MKNALSEKGQTTLELIMVMGIIVSIVTMIMPFTIKLYYTIHADALMKQTTLQKLAEVSIENGKHYKILNVRLFEPEYQRIAYNLCLTEDPGGNWEDQTRDEVTELIKHQTNIDHVNWEVQYAGDDGKC
ncbi:MAG: hypothetical protein GOV15_04415 [Candidatus Diapherotrites archaeon]|nr:hypothetical protein [Candidatus Diapherotrites archaeon]